MLLGNRSQLRETVTKNDHLSVISNDSDTTELPAVSQSDRLFNDIEHFLNVYYSLFLVIVGTVFNSLSILILRRPAFRHTTTSVYLRFLACVDMFVLYNGLSRHFVSGISGYNIRNISETFCKFNQWSSSFAPDISAWVLVAVTTERVMSIVWPHKVKSVCSKLTAGLTVVAISLVIIASNLPLFVFYGNKKVVDSFANTTAIERCVYLTSEYQVFMEEIWHWIDLAKFVILPASILIVFNVVIIVFVIRSRRRVMRGRGTQWRPADDGKCAIELFGESTTNGIHGNASSGSRTNSIACNSSHTNSRVSAAGNNSSHTNSRIAITACNSSHTNHRGFATGRNSSRTNNANSSGRTNVRISSTACNSSRVFATVNHGSHTNSRVFGAVNNIRVSGTNREVSLTITLVVINATFVICNTPIMICFLGAPYWFPPGFGPAKRATWALALMAMYSNNAANFLLYCATGSRFRAEIREVLTQLLRWRLTCENGSGRSDSEDNSDTINANNRSRAPRPSVRATEPLSSVTTASGAYYLHMSNDNP